jgi:lysophospholipase L1-like esterase
MSDIRLCCIGDSFTAGFGDEAFMGWPARLSAHIQDRLLAPGLRLTLYNLGIRRDTSADIAARWRDEAARRLPDGCEGRLVFCFGINDVTDGADGAPRLAAEEALRHTRAILAAAAAWKPTLLLTPPPVALADQPRVPGRLAALVGHQVAICGELKIPVIDLHGALLDHPEWLREMALGDGVHPGGAGYARLAALIQAWPKWATWLAGA